MQIRALVDLNLTSQILLSREFLPHLKRQKQGDLIFIGSEAALSGAETELPIAPANLDCVALRNRYAKSVLQAACGWES